ncbi:hypothetical protein K440DRAFT_664072 [Wilcoxina mikolae CBS 423.85]|nr:hypothetical protein K440DRAFT_664072 [Wilcoxina mikolae CBS 423.85]
MTLRTRSTASDTAGMQGDETHSDNIEHLSFSRVRRGTTARARLPSSGQHRPFLQLHAAGTWAPAGLAKCPAKRVVRRVGFVFKSHSLPALNKKIPSEDRAQKDSYEPSGNKLQKRNPIAKKKANHILPKLRVRRRRADIQSRPPGERVLEEEEKDEKEALMPELSADGDDANTTYTTYYDHAATYPFTLTDHSLSLELSLQLENIQVDDNDDPEDLDVALLDFPSPAVLRTQRHAGMSKVYREVRQRRSEKEGDRGRVMKRTKRRRREKVEVVERRGGAAAEYSAAEKMSEEYCQVDDGNRHFDCHDPTKTGDDNHRQFHHPLVEDPEQQLHPPPSTNHEDHEQLHPPPQVNLNLAPNSYRHRHQDLNQQEVHHHLHPNPYRQHQPDS